MSRERKRRRDERRIVGYVTINGVPIGITEWEAEGTYSRPDPVTGLLVPTNNFVDGSHKPETLTRIPTDRN